MSNKISDRLLGATVTIFTMILSFLGYSFISSFVTEAKVKELVNKEKQERIAHYSEIKTEIKLLRQVICYENPKACEALKQ